MAAFDLAHEFAAAPDAVAGAMTDAAFVASLRLPDLEPPDVLDRTSGPNGTVIRYRYQFVGRLDPIARRILGNDRISWVQEVRVDPSGTRGDLAVTADAHPERLQFSGDYTLVAHDGGTTRRLRGTFAIKVPLVGRRAEQHILPGLLQRIDLEAEATRDWLATAAG
jgi:uncharacterized protein DUF2505